jgi:hypothetical protein
MDESARNLIRIAPAEGPRQIAAWNASLFADYAQHLGPLFWQATPVRPTDQLRSFTNFLTILKAGIGAGHLTTPIDAAPASFLEVCLRDWLPAELPGIDARERGPLLAGLWNLAEGLLREPEWVNAYVLARTGDLKPGIGPEEFLIGILQPLFEPAPASRWQGPFRVTVLSMRDAEDDFLPGDQHLVAPSVLVVADRRRSVRLGIHLRVDGRSNVLGSFGATSPYSAATVGVEVAWERGEVRVGESRASLPFLREPFRWTVSPSGFIVASTPFVVPFWHRCQRRIGGRIETPASCFGLQAPACRGRRSQTHCRGKIGGSSEKAAG